MRGANGRVIAAIGLSAIAASIGWTAAASAQISYTVDLTWGATTPTCDGVTVFCSGVGTASLTSGLPAEVGDIATQLVLTQLPTVLQPGDDPVPIGNLRYCNGETAGFTDITSVVLDATFQVTGGGSGSASDVTTLFVTENTEDPVASADSLFLASDPFTTHAVLENECKDIPLLGRVTVQPTLTITLGPSDPTPPTTSTTTSTSTSTSTSTTSSTSTSTTTSTSTSTTSTTTTTSIPAVQTETTVRGDSTRVAGATQTNSGTGASGLAVTGASQTGPLVLFSVGLVMIGVATAKTALDRRWIATSHPGVRYTIDSRRRR